MADKFSPEPLEPEPLETEITALPPEYCFYEPRRDSDLHAQLGTYFCSDGNRSVVISDKCKLVFVINEIFAAGLIYGKLYIVKQARPADHSLAGRPIPDLLFVPGYTWTPRSRSEYFSLAPGKRVFQQIARWEQHEPTEPTIPIYVFSKPDIPPNIRIDSTLKLKYPPEPEKGLWLWTGRTPVCGGTANDIVRGGIVNRPADMPFVARRVDEASDYHRAYLERCRIIQSDHQDPCLSIKDWLLHISLLRLRDQNLVKWGEAMSVIHDAFGEMADPGMEDGVPPMEMVMNTVESPDDMSVVTTTPGRS